MKKFVFFLIFIALAAYIGLQMQTQKENQPKSQEKTELIPREVIFGSPDKSGVKLSHDGKYLSYIAPKDGVLNIFITPKDELEKAIAITEDNNRGIRSYVWSYDNKHIFYIQDVEGDENWQIHKVNISSREDLNLTPEKGVRNQIEKIGYKFPQKIIYSNNARNKSFYDIYELDVETNETKLLFKNDDFTSFTYDDDFNLRFLSKSTSDGGSDIFEYKDGTTSLFLNIPGEDVTTTGILGFDKTGRILYMTESFDNNTSKLVEINLDDRKKKTIYHSDLSDIAGIISKPIEKNIQAVATNFIKQEWEILDDNFKDDYDFLTTLSDGNLTITDRTIDDNFWIVGYYFDNKPFSYYLYDRKNKTASLLFSNKAKLEKFKLAPMQGLVIKSRDGLDLVSYLTLPLESVSSKNDTVPTAPVPLILLVHGGPSVRDNWGLDPQHQWLANRGYAVLSVNYRGSTGFGKKFFKAGFGEWAAKMHDDLIDAVDWSIANKITTKDKVCIMGGSYGGYATLVGLTFTPDVFACGVDIVGPSNLLTLLNSVPPYWKPALNFLINLTGGDPSTEEGKKILEAKSPLNFVKNIKSPLLIGQGANDPRVKQTEADQIVEAMQKNNIPVTYALYKDEGHGFARPENRISFYSITEGFLAQHLGGRLEPIDNNFEKSSIEIITGGEHIKDLSK